MRHGVTLLILCCLLMARASCRAKSAVEPWPSARGTINVVVANDHGIVVLTDSMLTQTEQNPSGVLISRQLDTPGQKLYQIDDRTLCAFAGFAWAATPPVPDFLNSVPSIMGRYQDRLRKAGALSFSDKLKLLEVVFTYYITGVANIRNGGQPGDYFFELLLAGYDLDGSPQVGRLVLDSTVERTSLGSLWQSITQQESLLPIAHKQVVCLNGIDDVATEMLRAEKSWTNNPTVQGCQDGDPKTALSLEQMKALAVSLKQHTAVRHKEVGGPNQMAVLSDGRSLGIVEQPLFPPITLSPFRFEIATGYSTDNSMIQGEPQAFGIISGVFTLFFKNRLIHVRQELDNSYFANNLFKDCILIYRGGKVLLEDSNAVTNCDLYVARGVRAQAPEVSN